MAFVNKLEKFVVEGSVLNLENGQTYDISRYISDINIRKDFVNQSFPLVVINMITTEEYRDIMRDNDVSVRLRVNKYTDINQEGEQDETSITIEDVVFDTVVRSYKKPFSATATRTEDDNENNNNRKDSIQLIPFQIVGIPEELVKKNRTIINEVYEDAKIDDILVNILSSVEDGPIFMDPSDNIEKEKSLMIPPSNVIPAIKYIQEVHGIYNSGMSLFFDFDGTYLSKIFADTRQYQNTLEIISVPANENNMDIKYTTPQHDENGNVRLYLVTPPPFVSLDKISMDALGQTTVFNSYDYNFDVVRRIYDQETNNRKTRYFWNSFQNKIFEESYINQIKKTSSAIMVNLKSTSPNYFKINTLYRVSTNNDYVNGEYNLIEMSYSIYTRDYRSYDSIVNLKLAKK
jgi:hypothetical protein